MFRLFHVLARFLFTTSEIERDYYRQKVNLISCIQYDSSIRFIKLYNKDKSKGKVNILQTLQEINHNDFSGFAFYRKVDNVFPVTVIMFKHFKIGKHIE